MILLLALQAIVSTPLEALPRQALPATGCAAYLWSRTDPPQLIAMAGTEPGSLRLSLGGRAIDLPRIAAEGATARGFASTSRYAAGEVSATLELVATEQAALSDGALVQEATLTVGRVGQDMVVTPLGGLIGCAGAARTRAGGR